MQLHRFHDIKEFCDRTQAYLLQHEAEHNLLLGITHTLLYYPDRYLWEDSVPVSFACGSQSLPFGARIGPVYTQPEYRRKGYATACVAALSQVLLDQGCHSCFLFTDLTNPTSNHIYQIIGYHPICDWQDYSFISKESPQ